MSYMAIKQMNISGQLAKAIQRGAHLSFMSQNQFLTFAAIQFLEKLGDKEIDDLVFEAKMNLKDFKMGRPYGTAVPKQEETQDESETATYSGTMAD